MRLSYVLLTLVLAGCGGGGGGDGYGGPTSPGGTGGTGNNPPPGSGSGSNPTQTATVTMRSADDGYGYLSFSFSPSSVTIVRGGTVTWTHDGASATHNVTFSAGTAGAPSNVGDISTGSASRTFNTAGSFSYRCTNHEGMTGTVVVQ